MPQEQGVALQESSSSTRLERLVAEQPGEPGRDPRSVAFAGALWAIVMLVSGTLCTVAAKVLFNVHAPSLNGCPEDPNGKICPFTKPWATVFVMKIAMSCCILIHMVQKRASPTATQASLATIMKISLPSFLDLLNVILSNIGLVWVSSSIYQMTRGSVVIFSAIMSVRMLGHRLFRHQYWAVGLVTVAIILVGMAGILASGTGESSMTEICFGLFLILVSQIVLAYQTIVEERMMVSEAVTPNQLTGYEGLWGVVFFVVLIPVLTLTPGDSKSPLLSTYHEDFVDSLYQVTHSWPLICWCIVYFVVIATYNLSGQYVTKYLSAVLRSILEACRTIGVWTADLFLFYVLSMKADGEAWTVWSFVELGGFCMLVYGTMSYKGLVPIPCAPVPRAAAPGSDLPSACSAPSLAGSWLA